MGASRYALMVGLGVGIYGQAADAAQVLVIHTFSGNGNGCKNLGPASCAPDDSQDGAFPDGQLITDATGALYGTATHGGINWCPVFSREISSLFSYYTYSQTCGVVFKLTPPSKKNPVWSEQSLYHFPYDEVAAGSFPVGRLALNDATGELYGMTQWNGTRAGQSGGTIFELTPPSAGNPVWTETKLSAFTVSPGSPGAYRDGVPVIPKLLLGNDGALYGITPDDDAIFMLSPPASAGAAWTYNTLHTFTGGADGGQPTDIVVTQDGAIYGTARLGGTGHGVAFELTPPATPLDAWTETILHDFAGGSDGDEPASIAVWKGALYGVTASGGNAKGCGGYGCGTVYRLSLAKQAPWPETVLYQFRGGVDGLHPVALLANHAGTLLYGATAAGGLHGQGTVFSLTPPASGSTASWAERRLAYPSVQTIVDLQHDSATDRLYGVTAKGGSDGVGTAFEITP